MITRRAAHRRALKAWRTKRRNAIAADYRSRALKAWRTKRKRYG